MRYIITFLIVCCVQPFIFGKDSNGPLTIFYHNTSSVNCSRINITIYLDKELTDPLHISIVYDNHHGEEVGSIFINSHPRLPSDKAELLSNKSALHKVIMDYLHSYMEYRIKNAPSIKNALSESKSDLRKLDERYSFPIIDSYELEVLIKLTE